MTNDNETNEQQDRSETVLWTHDNGIPYTVDDELNMQTGVPHFSLVVDEIEQWANVVQLISDEPHLHWQGPVSLDNMVGLGTIAYAMEQYGKALERSIIEANNLRSKLKALNEMNKELRNDVSVLIDAMYPAGEEEQRRDSLMDKALAWNEMLDYVNHEDFNDDQRDISDIMEWILDLIKKEEEE